MFAAIQELNQNLEQQAKLYHELKQLAELKQRALIQSNIYELEALTIHEEQLILAAGRLEQERLNWSEEFGQLLGEEPEELTLTKLAEQYPQLQKVREDLESVVGELQTIHESNAQLLHQALRVVDFTMNLFTRQEGTTYSRPGNPEHNTVRLSLLDKKI